LLLEKKQQVGKFAKDDVFWDAAGGGTLKKGYSKLNSLKAPDNRLWSMVFGSIFVTSGLLKLHSIPT
jgi:hypothetical protein